MGAMASFLLVPGRALGLAFPACIWPLLLLCNIGGLRKIIYAFGLGYGLSMASTGLLTWTEAPSSSCSTAACALYTCYGVRLVWFLLRRQASDKYNSSAHGKELNGKMEKTAIPVKCFVTLFVSLTQLATAYSLQPLAFASQLGVMSWLGLGVGTAGLLLEAVADEEKLAAKQLKPDDPVMTGTYSMVRHPNYLGEIMFWGGITAAVQGALPRSAPWLSRLQGGLGSVLMIWVMFGAAKRLDKTGTESKYKDNAEYKAWADSTPSLFPKLF